MQDVIVVCLNYRLHGLGFSCIPEMGIYGNAGLKDQQMALEWLNENIANFGGDPDNVTLIGESAGAVSAHFQALNEKSRKYFHKMILQSSNAFSEWTVQADAEEVTRNMIKLSGGRIGTPKQNYESLMSMNLKDMFNNRTKCRDIYDKRRNMPIILKPNIEMDNESAFITKAPIEIHRSGTFEFSMPVLMGQDTGDGLLQIDHYVNRYDAANNDFVVFLPHSIMAGLDSDLAKAIAAEMKQFYFGDQGLTEQTVDPHLIDLCNDTQFTNPLTIFMEICRKYHPHSRQFVYEFDLQTKLNVIKPLTKVKHLSGVFHSDELNYIFE